MTIYNVHIYREMRLVFGGIEADTQETAAAIARDKPESSTNQGKESLMTNDNYFRGASGTRYTYAEIADRIRSEAPHTLGEHISVQLEAIGLLDEMRNGATPCGLPFTFAEATKTYLVGVIERAIAYYMVEAKDARTAAENWQDGEFHDRDDEALDSEGPCNVRVEQPDGTWIKLPPSEWEAAPPTGDDPAKKPYSVLLLYPADVNAGGADTYYAFVEAPDPIAALALARRQAVTANECLEFEPEEFASLLVTEGHHADQPLFNK